MSDDYNVHGVRSTAPDPVGEARVCTSCGRSFEHGSFICGRWYHISPAACIAALRAENERLRACCDERARAITAASDDLYQMSVKADRYRTALEQARPLAKTVGVHGEPIVAIIDAALVGKP